MFDSIITSITSNLMKPLPGIEAHFEMAHFNREKITHTSKNLNEYKSSAVLILIFPSLQNKPSILFIERVRYNGYHSGQIAFPGGKAEIEDYDLQATALREFFEETGSDITPTVIGKLTPVYIPVSNYMVQPYVAYTNKKPNFVINPNEVSKLIECEISLLFDNNLIKETTIEPSPGYKLKTPYFDVHGNILWGATAMITNELKWIIKGSHYV